MSEVTGCLIPQLSPKARERTVTSIATVVFVFRLKLILHDRKDFGRSVTLRYLFIETDLICWPSVQTDRTYCLSKEDFA